VAGESPPRPFSSGASEKSPAPFSFRPVAASGIDRQPAAVSCSPPHNNEHPVSSPNPAPGADALQDPQLQKAVTALRENRPQAAEVLLRKHLESRPNDVTAMAILGETLLRFDRHAEAGDMLARAIELAPNFPGPRHTLVTVRLMQNRPAEAFAQIDTLLEIEPKNPNHHALKAMAHAWVGDHAAAAAEYEIVLAHIPKAPAPWLAYAHTLRTLGRYEDCVTAYRNTMKQFPKLGEPYWSLANLKTFRFTAAEIDAMRTLLAAGDLPLESRIQINFALGKALEDSADYAGSFEHYKEGNALKRATIGYNAEMTSVYMMNCKTLFTPSFFQGFAGSGSDARDPIFVVGLPRSGSTLIEQILSSHSQIEGTMELRVLPYLVGRIGAKGLLQFKPGQTHPALATDLQAPYPEILRNLDAESANLLGNEYIERARQHRTKDRPFFIDKMPDNFAHIGLIQMILPNAKIIDARRHPMACCFSSFKHYFPLGKDFSYGLNDLGRYYADYVDLMTHFDKVLPGKVHRVFYENVVENPEGEIRRLFDYLELPFEEHCLRFYETDRPVRTPSSEQVRMPIFRDGLEQWHHYEQWLGPLREALGPTLTGYADWLKRN
jgi:tetratricopeptide (TPR) repeat protein